jgi:hypothetical protein
MRISRYIPVGLAVAGLACGGPKADPNRVPVTTTQTKNAPSWIDNEEIPDGLAAVGIAQPNPMGDKSMQRTVAINDGRTKLAGKIKTRVQNMFSQLNQQVTSASADGKGKPIKSDVMSRVIENTTRNLVDQEVSGTEARGFYTDPSDGTLYVQIVMTKASMDKALQGTAQAQIQKEIAGGEKDLEKALDKLDAAIAASK